MKARFSILAAATALWLGAAGCMDRPTAPAGPPGDGVARAPSARLDGGVSPQLLVCPSTQTQRTSGVIGLLGGALSLGGMRIEIPSGAVLQPTLFEVIAPASQYMEVEIHAVGLASFLFHRPVDVTIDYSRCGADAFPADARLQGVYIDGQSKSILQLMGGDDDRDARRITFSTGHLSGYAVAY